MREATEYLIARDLPEALNDWTALADSIIPRQMWFSMRPDQFSPSKKNLRPGCVREGRSKCSWAAPRAVNWQIHSNLASVSVS